MAQRRIIQRPEWGARHEDGFGPRPVGALKVFVHHSVTIAPDLLPPFTDDYAAVRTLEAIGESRFGRGISYHFPITPAGLLFEGVSIDRIGAAITNYNTPTANIVLVGNYDVNRPPRPMLESLDWLLHHGVAKGWWRKPHIDGGHRDAPGAQTACPGRFAHELLDNVNRGEYHDGATEVDNPITPPSKPTVPSTLKEDGFWGSSVTRKLQKVLGTPVDGIVSSQSRAWAKQNPGLTTGWQWVADPRGSRVISALQELIGAEPDGKVGPDTIRRLQRRLGTPVDGVLSEESKAIKALQRRLNQNRL